ELAGHNTTMNVYRNGRTSGYRVYEDYHKIDKITKKRLVEGRFLNQTDIKNSKKVCVIGEETYRLLFQKGEKAVGAEIRINGVYFTVVGMYKPNNNINIDGENSIFIPFTTFQKAFNSGDRMGWMAIAVEPGTQVAFVERQIKDILKAKYDIHPKDERAIGSFDLSEIFNSISAFTTVLQGFSLVVGILTLLAGVIAISNILLITVKERTQEIGVRRALGATPKLVRRQILLEAIVLTTFAGLVGFSMAVGILAIMDKMWGHSDEFPFVKPMIGTFQFFFSFVMMVGLSVLIGLLPANRALKIRPIDALREE